MGGTKERILLTALRLFAADGYEAVSVSAIAGQLGMTKGALYKHYRNKRDIFESILARMEREDAQRAAEYGVPEGTAEQMPDAYRHTPVDDMAAFARAQFRYWTQDEFAASFLRMLTLEQYRNDEMGRLYQQYLGAGPLGYMTDLFEGLALPRPRKEAVRFYAPMFLLYSVYDGAEDKEAVTAMLDEAMEAAREHLKRLTTEKTENDDKKEEKT